MERTPGFIGKAGVPFVRQVNINCMAELTLGIQYSAFLSKCLRQGLKDKEGAMVEKPTKSFGIIFLLIAICLVACNVYAQSAQDSFNKAKELLSQMKYDQAFAEVTKAIQADPSVAEYYTFRGQLYQLKSDVASAIADYNKSIELNPNNGEVYYFRAICYNYIKEYDKARSDVRQAQSLGYTVPAFFINELQAAPGGTRSVF